MDFSDLASLILKIPLKFIYLKKNYFGIGYATFEKDLFEALRLYNGIQRLPEEVRHFILEQLDNDRVRIFGFENVSNYMNYINLIKLLLIALLGAKKLKKSPGPICLDFLKIAEIIEKRYEVVNDTLNNISVGRIWNDGSRLNQFFKAKTGLILEKDEKHKILTVDFVDKINISRKISHMKRIVDLDELKNYYHYSLQSLRKSPFYTDDYELELEETFYKRLREVTDLMLEHVTKTDEIVDRFQ